MNRRHILKDEQAFDRAVLNGLNSETLRIWRAATFADKFVKGAADDWSKFAKAVRVLDRQLVDAIEWRAKK